MMSRPDLAATEDRVEVDDQDHRLTILPRLPLGSDPNLAARHLAQRSPKAR
jgi:hypothetical protein